MTEARFPKRKYLRQLRDMRDDFWWWEASYRQAAQSSQVEWLQGRYLDRAAILEDVRVKLQDLFDAVDELPRLR